MNYHAIFHSLGDVKPVVRGEFLPLDRDDLQAVEELAGGVLPEDYRAYLAQFGAAAFRRRVRFTPTPPLPKRVSRSGTDFIDAFYGKEPPGRDMYSLLVRVNFYRGRMPSTIIAIGDNGCGNQICIGVAGEAAGKLFYWDRNDEFDVDEYLEENDGPVPDDLLFQNVYPVAASFADFLRSLAVDPDDE
jgi:hypothetical protein